MTGEAETLTAPPFPKTGSCVQGDNRHAVGRRGMPKDWVARMYADYLRLGSLSKAGKIHGRSRQSMFELFSSRGLKLNSRNFHRRVRYRGRWYTPGKGGYLRDTVVRRPRATDAAVPEAHLHRRKWADKHGPIPPGHQVGFKDGDKQNCRLSNLFCVPLAEMSSRTATGANQWTVTARSRLGMLLQGGGKLASQLRRGR